jgi:alpha-glucosidase
LYEEFMAQGVDGVWNDMNEPAVFESPGHTMPLDNWHQADVGLGGPGPHAQYHNVYGLLMSTATHTGVKRAKPDKRPFVLTRATFIGGHRVAAMWTGDNVANWEHLGYSIPMSLNLGLSAQPFNGPDIGGFKGPGTGELFARWMGIGALLPFARAHTEVGQIDKEPWSFGAEVERTCRMAIERRYQLMPLYYTLFHEASENGLPVVRPVFFADPSDARLREVDHQFLIGDGLMAVCRVDEGKRRRMAVMPRGVWRGVRLVGADDPELPEMFIRGGAIVPTGPVMEYADEEPLDPLTLLVCLDEDGRARGTLYEDAGEGYGYRDGEFRLTTFEAVRGEDGVVEVREVERRGRMGRADRTVVVRVIEEGREVVGWGTGGEVVRVLVGE